MTAIEWLINRLPKIDFEDDPYYRELLIEAKELERQQIIDSCYFAYNEGCSYMTDGKTEFESFEQYYNETFKNK